jgi:hypothetical protein
MLSRCDVNPSRLFTTPPLPLAVVGDQGDHDGLGAVDELLATYAHREREQAAHTRDVLLERERFTQAATSAFERFKPTLGDFAERLNDHGGGGLVEEQPAAGRHGERVTLWMSLEGPVVAPPRTDRNPYIQLEIDVLGRRVTVWEGDMWHKRGASRRAEPLALEELTTESVIGRAVGALGRAVSHGSVTDEGAQ